MHSSVIFYVLLSTVFSVIILVIYRFTILWYECLPGLPFFDMNVCQVYHSLIWMFAKIVFIIFSQWHFMKLFVQPPSESCRSRLYYQHEIVLVACRRRWWYGFSFDLWTCLIWQFSRLCAQVSATRMADVIRSGDGCLQATDTGTEEQKDWDDAIA